MSRDATPGRGSGAVYVVVLNWNGWRDTLTCAESVLAQTARCPLHLVICDNASTDDSVQRIRDWAGGRLPAAGGPLMSGAPPAPQSAKPVRLIECIAAVAGQVTCPIFTAQDADGSSPVRTIWLLHTGANRGFAGGCNVGMRMALARGDCDFVWLLNNDAVATAGCLDALLERADCADRPALVGSTLLNWHPPHDVQALAGGIFQPARAATRHVGEGLPWPSTELVQVREVESQIAYIVGASMLASRPFMEFVGLMAEDYFLYFEELDWAERGRRQYPGFHLAYAPASVVLHRLGASTGTGRSELSWFYLTRNRLLFVQRFFPDSLRSARMAVALDALKWLLRGRLQRALMAVRAIRGSLGA